MATEYEDFPSHPLADVPDEVLEAARKPLRDITRDVTPEDFESDDMPDAIADAIVIELKAAGYLKW